MKKDSLSDPAKTKQLAAPPLISLRHPSKSGFGLEDFFRDPQFSTLTRTPDATSPKASRVSAVLIVHSSPVTRLGLAALINASPQFRVCAEADSAPVARELFTRHRPDIALLGLSLGQGDGIELIKDFRKHAPSVATLVVTFRGDSLSLERAFRAGARGYVLACDDTADILRGLTRISAGEFYASASATQLLLANVAAGALEPAVARVAALSDRELQIFRLIGAGVGPSRAAAELHLSVKTIEAHRSHIKEKLGLASGAELNARASRWLVEHARPTFRRPTAPEEREQPVTTAAPGGSADPHSKALALVSRNGVLRSATSSARALLAEFFSLPLDSAELPSVLAQWLGDHHGRRSRPFTINNARAQLVISLLHPEADETFCILLETRALGAPEARLRSLGLTGRQVEVLRWIAQGKSNSDIAIILGVSINTVNNHVTQILEKLGVDNRTAAAVIAADVVSQD